MPGPDYSYTLYDKGYIQLGYDFRFAKDKKDNPLYILDWPADGDSTRYNLLPSTAEALSQMMDSNNSYRYTQQKREHQWQLTYNVPLAPACDLKLSVAVALAQSEPLLSSSTIQQGVTLPIALRTEHQVYAATSLVDRGKGRHEFTSA